MSEIPKDYEPAFPGKWPEKQEGGHVWRYATGISERDWFAGKAMQGELANGRTEWFIEDADDLASFAYVIADAMLRARKAKP